MVFVDQRYLDSLFDNRLARGVDDSTCYHPAPYQLEIDPVDRFPVVKANRLAARTRKLSQGVVKGGRERIYRVLASGEPNDPVVALIVSCGPPRDFTLKRSTRCHDHGDARDRCAVGVHSAGYDPRRPFGLDLGAHVWCDQEYEDEERVSKSSSHPGPPLCTGHWSGQESTSSVWDWTLSHEDQSSNPAWRSESSRVSPVLPASIV